MLIKSIFSSLKLFVLLFAMSVTAPLFAEDTKAAEDQEEKQEITDKGSDDSSSASKDVKETKKSSFSGKFRDDFTGDELGPEWEVIAEDKDRWAMVDNDYLMLLSYGPDPKNIIKYVGDLPKNYEIVVKFENGPENSYQSINLSISMDDDNYINIRDVFDKRVGTDFYFQKAFKKDWSEKKLRFIKGLSGKKIYLKLKKKGVEYTSYYSRDGGKWNKIGSLAFIGLEGVPMVYTKNRNKGGPESGIKIDYFELKEIK